MAHAMNRHSASLRPWLVATCLAAVHSAAAAADDPMRPSYRRPAGGGGATQTGGPRLQAVFGDTQARVAIVNGQVLTVGSRIDGLTVTSIGAHSVELRQGARSVSLSLAGASNLSGGE